MICAPTPILRIVGAWYAGSSPVGEALNSYGQPRVLFVSLIVFRSQRREPDAWLRPSNNNLQLTGSFEPRKTPHPFPRTTSSARFI
jgi:hypothetical protein